MSRSPRNKHTEKKARDDAQKAAKARPVNITASVLRRRLPLPRLDAESDKEMRGRVLVIGGGREMPGAVVLAATAALRAGAGKLQIATGSSVALLVGAQVPESRVFALPETKSGAIAASAAQTILERAAKSQAVCIGPGMIDEEAIARLMKAVVPRMKNATLVVDANALNCLAREPQLLHSLQGRAIVTPHAEEMAIVRRSSKDEVARNSLETARDAARELRAVVVLKGRETVIAAPTGETYSNRAGNVGLATSGSGDTLAGLITGLAARGAAPLQAAVWGVHLHALAGDRLAGRAGLLGYLAREIPAEVPHLMSELDGRKSR